MLDRGRAVDVTGHQQGTLAVLAQTQRQLGRHGRLACALQAHQHDDIRRRPGEVERRGVPQQGDQLLMHNLDDLLCRRQAAHDFRAHGPFLDRGHKILDHLEVDVRFQQSKAHLAHGRVDVRFRQFALAAQLVKDSLEFVSETLKHCVARFVSAVDTWSMATKICSQSEGMGADDSGTTQNGRYCTVKTGAGQM